MLVCVGIASYDGKVCAQTVDSLMAEQVLGAAQGVHFLVQWEIGCGLIGIARNRLAKKFLSIPDADRMVMIDSDISWSAGVLLGLSRLPEQVVGGTYLAKREGEHWHVDGKPEPVGDKYRVDGVPGGFLKIDRSVFETIAAMPYLDAAGRECRDYFPTGFHNGRLYGEDYGFCRLWRESGGEVFLDPSIKLRHHDGSRAFAGDPREWLESKAA